MSHWIKLVLALVALSVAIVESRVIPAEPIMMDAYGNPVVFLREKRTPVRPYPQQAMMFTSYYRPVRRSNNQATGVFAQGNAVSGQAFFDMQSPLMKNGPEPIEEPEISSAEAQAAPIPEENIRGNEEEPQEPENYQPEEHDVHRQEEDKHYHQHEYHGEHPHHEEHHHQNAEPPQEQEPEPMPVYTTEAPVAIPAKEPVPSNSEATVSGSKNVKKTRKPPVIVEEDDEDDETDDDEPMLPFIPMKGNRRRQGYPNLNNFFPMVFSFPGVATRSGSESGSPPGAVTAIANSYSTGKGGVASSVATAYGGSPASKKKRMPPSEE